MSAPRFTRPLVLIAMAAVLAAPSVAQTQQTPPPAPPASPPSAAPARPGFDWPASMRNAQVLPANTDAATLRATMIAFATGLGVRCSHCHVGGEDVPMASRDFASDANPKKAIARAMMRMTRGLNSETLAAIPGLTQPRVTCYSCHRGAVTPLLRPEPPVLVPTPPPPLPPVPPPAH